MKLGKTAKKKEIVNPLRPHGAFEPRYTSAWITENHTSPNMKIMRPDLTIRVDATGEPLFINELTTVIPSKEIYRDNDLELWYIHPKRLDFVKQLCVDYFHKVTFEDKDRNRTVLKDVKPKPVKIAEPVSTETENGGLLASSVYSDLQLRKAK